MDVSLRAGIPPFHVMDVWLAADERQRSHGDLVNLSAGQPSAGAPTAVREAAVAALNQGPLGYTVALGLPELRAEIAMSYRKYGVDVSVDEVVLTTGSSGGFLLTFLACFDVGDRVAIASPGYPCYRNILTALGCEVVEMPCGPETRFQPTVEMLEALDPPVAGVIVASPANPTGTVIPPTELAAIARWCDEAGVRLVSDEVYHGLVYPGAPETSCAWETSRNAVVVNSFSKYFAMTGWRLGWLLVPTGLQRAVDRLTGNFTICRRRWHSMPRWPRSRQGHWLRPTDCCRTTPTTARCCSTACAASVSIGWPRPTAPSTCTPTSAITPTTP
ncbi:aspartate aminotransferase [Mycolicibacterium conceptionense]|uniref:Aminotransferase n=1 Tax=Mycolicibacterium conceptionense TaxID=451644 RepID=A0A0U1DW00_9MYCO|nr:aspartate aminotransferase [Mycolicibacterium conceptionense]